MVYLNPLFLRRVPGESIKVVVYGLQQISMRIALLLATDNTMNDGRKAITFSCSQYEAQARR